MAIQNIGGIQDVLKNHKAKDWVKNSNVEFEGDLSWAKEIKMPETGKTEKTFGDFLASSLSDVNSLQHKANVAIQKLATGENKNLHETMLTVEKAEIAFKQMNQVRQKVLEAYREVMRMQV